MTKALPRPLLTISSCSLSLMAPAFSYNLHRSPYKFTVKYDDIEITYHFSSLLYRNKFDSKIEENRQSINKSLYNRFGINIEFDKLADLKLYSTIEKRGFLISSNGDNAECLNDIILDGQKMTFRR